MNKFGSSNVSNNSRSQDSNSMPKMSEKPTNFIKQGQNPISYQSKDEAINFSYNSDQ